MEFESGCVANFTASRVSTERIRKLRFFQPHQYVSLDYSRQDVLVLTVDDLIARAQPAWIRSTRQAWPPARFPASHLSSRQSSSKSRLRAELSSFLRAVRERLTPEVTLEDGRRALALAMQIVEAIAEHSRRAQLIGIDSGTQASLRFSKSPMLEELVTIAKFLSLGEAKLAQGKLVSAGISAFVCDENMHAMNWHMGMALGGIRLQVPDSQVVRALEVLDDFEPEEPAGRRDGRRRRGDWKRSRAARNASRWRFARWPARTHARSCCGRRRFPFPSLRRRLLVTGDVWRADTDGEKPTSNRLSSAQDRLFFDLR